MDSGSGQIAQATFKSVGEAFVKMVMILSDEELVVLHQSASVVSTMAEAMVKAAVPGAPESEVFVAGLYSVHIRGTAAPWMHMNPGPADVDEHQMYPRDDHKIHHHLHLFLLEISSSPFTKVNEILSDHTDSSNNSSRPCFNKRDTHEFSYEVGRWNPSYGFATVRKPLKTKLLYFKT
jgi:hypothetical protein